MAYLESNSPARNNSLLISLLMTGLGKPLCLCYTFVMVANTTRELYIPLLITNLNCLGVLSLRNNIPLFVVKYFNNCSSYL